MKKFLPYVCVFLFFHFFHIFLVFAQQSSSEVIIPTVSGTTISMSGTIIDFGNQTIITGNQVDSGFGNFTGNQSVSSSNFKTGNIQENTNSVFQNQNCEELNAIIKCRNGSGYVSFDKQTGRIIGISGTQTGSTNNTVTGQTTVVFLSGSDELENAILWMYANGLTMFQTKQTFRIEEKITREQMAKMIVQAYRALGLNYIPATGCEFSDIASTDPTLRPFVITSCEMGLLKGWDKKFHPQAPLTRAQVITLLIRMLGGKEDQNIIPWRQHYATQAQAVGLISSIDPKKMDLPIARGDVAVLVYRAKNISENRTLMSQARLVMQDVVNTQTQKVDTALLNDSMSLLTQGITAGDDPELREAVFWMFQQQMTIYNDVEKFRPFDQITKQEAAKLIGQFHQKFFKTGSISTTILPSCIFKDIAIAQKELQPYITYVCMEGLLKGQQGYFSPTHPLTKAEFVAAIIRMLGKDLTVSGNIIWWQPYFDIGLQLGLVSHLDKIAFVKNYPVTRYEVALILYRFWIKYKFLSSLNTNTIENQVISMVENSVMTLAGERQGKVYITTTRFTSPDFKIGYIELFDQRYKIVKEKIDSYFGNGIVWYGYIYDLSTDKPIGTMRLSILNTTVLDGNIKPDLSGSIYYEIVKPEETNSYYIIREKGSK